MSTKSKFPLHLDGQNRKAWSTHSVQPSGDIHLSPCSPPLGRECSKIKQVYHSVEPGVPQPHQQDLCLHGLRFRSTLMLNLQLSCRSSPNQFVELQVETFVCLQATCLSSSSVSCSLCEGRASRLLPQSPLSLLNVTCHLSTLPAFPALLRLLGECGQTQRGRGVPCPTSFSVNAVTVNGAFPSPTQM